jgi:hypothetical protein
LSIQILIHKGATLKIYIEREKFEEKLKQSNQPPIL